MGETSQLRGDSESASEQFSSVLAILLRLSILENDKDTARDLYKEAEKLFEGIVTTGDSHVEEAKGLLIDLRELVSIWRQ